jgi:hypothetical protein
MNAPPSTRNIRLTIPDIDHQQVDPNHLVGVTRYPTLSAALKSEKLRVKDKQWAEQCKAGQIIPDQLLPPPMRTWVEEGVIYDPPVSAIPYGTPIPDRITLARLARYNRAWSGQPVPPGTPAYKLVPAPDWTPAMRHTDLAAIQHEAAPSPHDAPVIAKLVLIHFDQHFKDIAHAQAWAWSRGDVEMTYVAQVKEQWCSSNRVSELRQRYAQHGYQGEYVTRSSYQRLVELEEEGKDRQLDPTDIRQREQAARRQRKRRRKMPKDLKARLRLKDRQRKHRKNISAS